MEKNREVLYEMHYNKKLSSLKIAEEYGVSSRTIRYWFYDYGIQLIGNSFQKGSLNLKNKIKSGKEKERLRTINIGRIPHNKGVGSKTFECIVCNKSFEDKPYRRSVYCSRECRNNSQGEKHCRYKGLEGRGVQTKRNWKIYKDFKKAVHIRDDNKCRICLSKGTEVHHLESYSKNEHVRFLGTNGVLLCKKCHTSVHILCGRNNYSFEKFAAKYTFCLKTNTWSRIAEHQLDDK